MRSCPSCGAPAAAGAQACVSCGTALPAPPGHGPAPGAAGTPYAPPSASPSPYGYAPPPQFAPPPGWSAQRNSGKAIAAMVLGICSIPIYPLGLPLGLTGMLLAFSAKADIRTQPSVLKGNGMATAGIACGAVGMAFGTIFCGALIFALSQRGF